MRFVSLACLMLLASTPIAAKPLTVGIGETWVFSIEGGQPVNARKVVGKTKPSPGQMLVTVKPVMGTTMTVSNNSRFDYAYRATLILPGNRTGPAKSCAVPANGRAAIEHWQQQVEAVRLSDFQPAPAGSLCP